MAYSNIESKVEAALIALINTAIAADATLAAAGIAVRGYWTDDVSGAADTLTLPLIGLSAAPNVPYGYRSPKRRCSVAVTMATAQCEDRDRVLLKLMYDAVRKIMDETEPTASGLTRMQIEVADGGEPIANDDVNMLVFPVNAQMDVTPVA